MPWRLKRVRQCAKCPWKVSTDPRTIPNGYCETKHAALAGTIARPGALNLGGALRVMACHEHDVGDEAYCVGWLMNQLGPGNNIALRLAMRDCENVGHITLVGEQHKRFEDTLPAGPTPEFPGRSGREQPPANERVGTGGEERG
ncbi:DUF6283 family protein [Amorphus sp. 3PC139-8]|uniref:DUF6283 family protein n=1 Tax=Amorphus sp. 3PC139-8 TaxID=2735676 RepID=UPI00345D1E3D